MLYYGGGMLNKMLKAIHAHDLLAPGDAVLVAFSGGPDSVALLDALVQLRDEWELRSGAVYVNHGIRPDEAAAEERFCAELCRRLGVQLAIERVNVPGQAEGWGVGLEEAGRRLRYEIFERLAREQEYDRVALGHHLDDQAETVLFRVLRGTGLKGLRGIPVRRGRYIRPLLAVGRDEILAYLTERGLDYCEDRSNADYRYRRNFLRHELLPVIRERVNPNVNRALAELADTVGDEEGYLEETAVRAREECVTRTVGGKFALALAPFEAYDRWIRRRVLRYCLAEVSGSAQAPDKEVVDRLDRACCGRRKGVSLPGGVQATRAGNVMVIGPDTPRSYERVLELGAAVRLDCPPVEISVRSESYEGASVVVERGTYVVRVDRAKLKLPLVVRSIEAGDRFDPLGLDGTKKVGDYLTDRKVPAVYRDEIPVVCDSKGIIWLVGYEIADRVKIDGSTKEVLRIECTTIERD